MQLIIIISFHLLNSYRSKIPESVRIIFYITVDESCVHVNYLPKSNEAEFLFVPYSVFTVIDCKEVNPEFYEIQIKAADDNKYEPEDLPLSNWH